MNFVEAQKLNRQAHCLVLSNITSLRNLPTPAKYESFLRKRLLRFCNNQKNERRRGCVYRRAQLIFCQSCQKTLFFQKFVKGAFSSQKNHVSL